MLLDDLAFPGSYDFAHPDLFHPFEGLGGGQVDKIPSGNKQNKEGRARENVDIGDIAVGSDFSLELGMEQEQRRSPAVVALRFH